VMGDPGLRKHYRCDPPFAFEPETFTETHDAPIVAPDADE
jgi:hypothetical protein